MKTNEYINSTHNVFPGFFGLMGTMKKTRHFLDIPFEITWKVIRIPYQFLYIFSLILF